jgi:hypothetical protein
MFWRFLGFVVADLQIGDFLSSFGEPLENVGAPTFRCKFTVISFK